MASAASALKLGDPREVQKSKPDPRILLETPLKLLGRILDFLPFSTRMNVLLGNRSLMQRVTIAPSSISVEDAIPPHSKHFHMCNYSRLIFETSGVDEQLALTLRASRKALVEVPQRKFPNLFVLKSLVAEMRGNLQAQLLARPSSLKWVNGVCDDYHFRAAFGDISEMMGLQKDCLKGRIQSQAQQGNIRIALIMAQRNRIDRHYVMKKALQYGDIVGAIQVVSSEPEFLEAVRKAVLERTNFGPVVAWAQRHEVIDGQLEFLFPAVVLVMVAGKEWSAPWISRAVREMMPDDRCRTLQFFQPSFLIKHLVDHDLLLVAIRFILYVSPHNRIDQLAQFADALLEHGNIAGVIEVYNHIPEAGQDYQLSSICTKLIERKRYWVALKLARSISDGSLKQSIVDRITNNIKHVSA